MARYRIHRMKDTPRESFRWAPHTGGLSIVKPKDYEDGGELEAFSPYLAWKLLMDDGRPLHPGDLLERISPDGTVGGLQIVKYIGFEPAQWYIPESKPENVHSGEQQESVFPNSNSRCL